MFSTVIQSKTRGIYIYTQVLNLKLVENNVFVNDQKISFKTSDIAEKAFETIWKAHRKNCEDGFSNGTLVIDIDKP